MKKKVSITFDLDYTDYVAGGRFDNDEFEMVWPFFKSLCEKIPELKTTWFIRIDGQIDTLYGAPDFIFTNHSDKIKWLRENGHEIGWHFHSYKIDNNKWVQNSDVDAICMEMKQMLPYVKKLNLNICRMGWAYHNNETIKTISEMGFELDFSALPRPKYKWDNPYRDWSTTTLEPYKPSKTDYRTTSTDAYDFWIVPISTFKIKSPNDTELNVKRYLNPAYHHHIFEEVVKHIDDVIINTVSHPYELLDNTNKHDLLAFSKDHFEKNIITLKEHSFDFVVASKLFDLD